MNQVEAKDICFEQLLHVYSNLKYPSSSRLYLKLWTLSAKMIFVVYLSFQHSRCTRAGKNHFWAC